jgi:hypothetical protein
MKQEEGKDVKVRVEEVISSKAKHTCDGCCVLEVLETLIW